MADDHAPSNRRVLLSMLKKKQERIQEMIRAKASFSEVKPIFTEMRRLQKALMKKFPFLLNRSNNEKKSAES